MTYTDVYCNGHIRAAGCSPGEKLAAIPYQRVRHAPTKRIRSLILTELAKRRQWSPRSMKLAPGAAIDRHQIHRGKPDRVRLKTESR